MEYKNRSWTSEEGVLLLEKGKRGLLRVIFGRTFVVTALLVLQIGLLFMIPRYLNDHFPLIVSLSGAISVIVGIYILNTNAEPTIKTTWICLVLAVPVFGVLLYIYIRTEIGHRALRRRLEKIMQNTNRKIDMYPEVLQKLKTQEPELYHLAAYVQHTGSYPICENSTATYFPLGEDKFAELLVQLEKAEHFIFLEYFIVAEGYMWGRILDILARKAAEGVEVRLMYDGTCEFFTLPHDYPQKLEKLGIKCKEFAPIMPVVSTHYNFRDHRKIVVIDGNTAFTGGVNLADEYINQKKRFGHWKDTAVMIKGDAVRSFTLMFLQMWHVDVPGPNDFSWLDYPTLPPKETTGFIMPYGDCPLDDYRVGEMVYLDILNHAEKYVHIMSPYLILDGEMQTALTFCAQRGVEVALILPHVPDKKAANALAKGHYGPLLAAGVKIYEYAPGFVHAKNVVSDDKKAVVGTINMDYRSFYHHFECAAYLYDLPAVMDVERDFQKTLAKCLQVTEQTVRHEKLSVRLLGAVLKVFAPLM